MVEIIRRRNVNIQSPDVSSGAKATASAIRAMGEHIGRIGEKYDAKLQKEEEKADKEYQEQVKQNLKTEQDRLVSEQKAFDASDKIVAADRIGRLKNDLLRWNLSQRENNPNYIGTPEHERAMRDEYSRLSSKYGAGLGEAGSAEFTEKTQSAVNDFISNDVKWAYRQKIKQGEESAKKIAQTMNQNAAMYGANGDVEGFKEAHKEGREQLKEYGEQTMPVGIDKALQEVDTKSAVGFLSGMAQTDPEKAKAIIQSKENLKEVLPEDMIQDLSNQKRIAENRALADKVIVLNAGIANAKDKKEAKKLTKERDKVKKQIEATNDTDYDELALDDIQKQLTETVGKEIDYQINAQKQEIENEKAVAKVDNTLAFMDNPIIYNADMSRVDDFIGENSRVFENPEIKQKFKEKTEEIFNMSDKVGDGQINPLVLRSVVEQVASITVGDNGQVDDNLIKALDADIELRKAGASPEQLQTYHKMAQMALTDTNFKQSVAALANKPDFNTMFLNTPSRGSGIASWFRTAKDDDIAFVENLGRQAYIESMAIMSSGQEDAMEKGLANYDERVAQAYDYIKRDIIDVDYVKRELAKMGSAMVELNGNMTKIVGRLPNGEYIVESTGEKVNGTY